MNESAHVVITTFQGRQFYFCHIKEKIEEKLNYCWIMQVSFELRCGSLSISSDVFKLNQNNLKETSRGHQDSYEELYTDKVQ